MTIRRTIAVLALVVLLVACRKRSPAKVEATSFQLPDGLQVELLPGRCGEGTTVAVWFAVGSDHDPQGRSGMSHVVDRMLRTRGRTVDAGTDHTAYTLSSTPDKLGEELAEVAAEMTKLDLEPVELSKAALEVFTDLEERHGGDAALTAMSYAAEAVQPTPGDGWRGGIKEQVDTMALQELEAFWQAHFKPSHARLLVVGRFDPAAVKRSLEQAFADVPAGSAPVARTPVVATVTGTLVMGSAPTAVAIAVPVPRADQPSYPAVLLLAARPTTGDFAIDYDPIGRPEILFVTGAVRSGEQPEAGAARIRAGLDALLARPLERGDVVAAKARFATFLAGTEHDAALCANDPRAYLLARARRAQLGIDGAAMVRALDAVTPARLAEAAVLFDAKHTAAVIGGGPIR